MNAVKVISSVVKSGVRFIKFLRFGKDDVQEMRQIGPYGTDAVPIENLIAIYAPTSEKGKAVIIGYINKNQKAEPGDHRIFATKSDGVEVFDLWLRSNGTAEFGGDADNMVRYSVLKSEFDKLKSDHNKLVQAFNIHVHATAATGPPVPPTPVGGVIPASNTTADIAGSKIDEIKTS